MSIESEIFKRSRIDIKKIENYGFKKNNELYVYEKKFLGNEFKAIITIDKENKVNGKVIDLQDNNEYFNIRTEMSGEFVNKVRNEYENILIDIKNRCFEKDYFISKQANRITKYIRDKYNNEPEFLWSKFKGYGVFRNSFNQKWYGLIMNIDLSKLENKNGEVEIINLKLDENKISKMLNKKGFYNAYHMNKKDWISIILNDTLKDDEIIELLEESYDLINKDVK